MSSNNNDDKSDKIDIKLNKDSSRLSSDFFVKQNLKTQKNKQNTKKNKSLKLKDKDSIFSGSSNENDNNNSSEENNKEQNDNNISTTKDIIDINDSGDNNDNNDNKINNFISSNNEDQKEENQNISRSMSSKSNLSRSRSRSLSEKNSNNSQNEEQNNNYDSQNQEKGNKNLGNKFKNYRSSKRQRNTNNSNNQSNNNTPFIMKNGCCRSCMKAFSKNGKSCLCQVPRRERKFFLPETGCNYCGCHGCNPIDIKYNKRLQQKNILFQDNTINHKNQRILDSEDEDLKVNDDLVDRKSVV